MEDVPRSDVSRAAAWHEPAMNVPEKTKHAWFTKTAAGLSKRRCRGVLEEVSCERQQYQPTTTGTALQVDRVDQVDHRGLKTAATNRTSTLEHGHTAFPAQFWTSAHSCLHCFLLCNRRGDPSALSWMERVGGQMHGLSILPPLPKCSSPSHICPCSSARQRHSDVTSKRIKTCPMSEWR